MTIHLKSAEFIDALDGTLPRLRSQHLVECQRCKAELARLERVSGAVRAADDVPEPSPLYWDHFSRRVHAAAAAAVEESPWWRQGWRPVAAIAGVVVALLLAVSVRPELGPWRGNGGAVVQEANQAVVLIPGYEAARDDESLSFMAAAVPIEELQQIAQPSRDATEAMVALLTPEQREELIRLIKAENRSSE